MCSHTDHKVYRPTVHLDLYKNLPFFILLKIEAQLPLLVSLPTMSLHEGALLNI